MIIRKMHTQQIFSHDGSCVSKTYICLIITNYISEVSVFQTEGRERENAPAPDARTYHLGPTSTQPSTITGEQMAKLRSELDVVKVNITVLRELLGTLKSGPESTSAKNEDYQLMEELVVTCREMHKRILELIPIITNEEITCEHT